MPILDKDIKKKDHIEYKDSTHSYTNVKTLERYTSVSKWTKRWEIPFVATPQNTERTRVEKGFDTMDQVIEFWKQKAEASRTLGNYIHWVFESMIINNLPMSTIPGFIIDNYGSDTPLPLEETIIYCKALKEFFFKNSLRFSDMICEDILWDDELKLAGQSDLVVVNDEGVHILDYKTNQKPIVFDGYKGEKMKEPFQDYGNGDLTKYWFQLLVYGKLAASYYGKPLKSLTILHIWEQKVTPISLEINDSLTNKILYGNA